MERATEQAKLNNLQKVAAVLVSLGPETSATILKHLETSQVERIVREIVHMKHMDPGLRLQALEEFKQQCLTPEKPAPEKIGYTEKLFSKGKEMMPNSREALADEEQDVLSALGKTEVGEILALVKDEHPQIIALVLGRLPAAKAAAVLSGLPENLRPQVALRVAKSDLGSSAARKRLAEAWQQKTAARKAPVEPPSPGSRILAEILRNTEHSIEREVLQSLCRQDPGIAYYLQKRLLGFESLGKLDTGGLQLLLREISREDLLLALQGTGETLKQTLLGLLPEREQKGIAEGLAAATPVSLREVEAAQMRIVALLRDKVAAGKIVIQPEERSIGKDN